MVIKGRKYHDQGDGFAELETFLIRAKIVLNGREKRSDKSTSGF